VAPSPGESGPRAAERRRKSSGVPRPRSRWLALGALGIVAASACGDPLRVEDVLGVWNTQSIGGHAVPGTVVYDGAGYDTEYVRWAFYDGGLCTLTQLVDGVTATYDDCEYTVTVQDEAITVVFQSDTWDGTVAGDRMTLTDPQAVTWLLGRQ
jgi:hypothetical protein